MVDVMVNSWWKDVQTKDYNLESLRSQVSGMIVETHSAFPGFVC